MEHGNKVVGLTGQNWDNDFHFALTLFPNLQSMLM
jgi:hypothetical protein